MLEYFTKACHTHVKRYAVPNSIFWSTSNTVSEPICDFKVSVSNSDYRHIIDFPYMKLQVEVTEFMEFISNLDIKKVQGVQKSLLYNLIIADVSSRMVEPQTA